MGDAFDRITLAVREVVHRIDAPLPTRAVVRRFMDDAIHDRVAQVDIAGGHIDLGAQHARAVGEFAFTHALEQLKVFFHRSFPIRTLDARLGQRATVPAHFFRALIVNVSLPLLDQLDGERIELVGIVGGVESAVFPVEA